MKKNKNNLDEMQEQKLLKIEHNGFWIAFWGLFASVYIQMAIGNTGFDKIGGEAVLMTVIAVYLFVSCIKNGIWDRKLKPNFKTNMIISLIVGAFFGVYWFFVSYNNYHALVGSIATGVMMFIQLGGSVLLFLSLATAIYNKRMKKLENEPEEDENEVDNDK